MSETDATTWRTYALRAWLGALLARTHPAREELEARIDAAEKEVARLHRQHDRTGSVIESLQVAMGGVNARLLQLPAATTWAAYSQAWLGALLAQTRRSREELEARIDAAEKEVARLHRQHDRTGSVIESLQVGIGRVDGRLRQITEIGLSLEEHDAPAHNERNESELQEGPKASRRRQRPRPDTPPYSSGETGP